MPNPLTQFTQRVTSKRPPRNPGIAGVQERDIDPTEPVLEYYEGDNNAWRGTEAHGVKSPEHAKAYDGRYDNAENAAVITEYEDEPKVIEPIPVVVVNQSGREFRRWRPIVVTVTNDRPVQLVGRNMSRTSIVIENTSGANDVWLSPEAIYAPRMVGYELLAGANVKIDSQDEVWAICEAAAGVTVNMIEYYTVAD